MLFHSKILCCRKSHIRYEQSLHSGILGGIDEGDDTVKCSCIGEGIAEEIVVIVGHTHTTQDNLVGLGTHGHHGHHLIEGLVGVGKEGDLLTRHQGIVQVDAGNTRGNELTGLLTPDGIHTGSAYLHLASFYSRSSIDGVAIGIEEAACQLFAYLQSGRLAQESDFGIGGNASCALKDLESDIVSRDSHHLGQLAIDACQFVVTHALGLEHTGSLGYLAYLRIYFLKCCCHTYIYLYNIACTCFL